jgi:hypothetical protein
VTSALTRIEALQPSPEPSKFFKDLGSLQRLITSTTYAMMDTAAAQV